MGGHNLPSGAFLRSFPRWLGDSIGCVGRLGRGGVRGTLSGVALRGSADARTRSCARGLMRSSSRRVELAFDQRPAPNSPDRWLWCCTSRHTRRFFVNSPDPGRPRQGERPLRRRRPGPGEQQHSGIRPPMPSQVSCAAARLSTGASLYHDDHGPMTSPHEQQTDARPACRAGWGV